MRLATTVFGLLLVLSLTARMTMAQTPTVTVHDRVLHKIDPRTWGQFMERPSWGRETGPEAATPVNTNELRPWPARLIRELRPTVLRFPGGTDVDFIDWTDMIDHAPGRETPERPVESPTRNGNTTTNRFGYDEFLEFVETFPEDQRPETILVVNLLRGLNNRTQLDAARHAAALAAYVNAPLDRELPAYLAAYPQARRANGRANPYDVTYFQLGNETWFFTDGVKKRFGDQWVERWVDTLTLYMDEILKADPDARFIVDCWPLEVSRELHNRRPEAPLHFAWHRYHPWSMQKPRRLVEGVSLDTPEDDVDRKWVPVPLESLSAADLWRIWVACPTTNDRGLAEFHDPALDQARELGTPLAMTEWNWNGWWAEDDPALDSWFAMGVGVTSTIHAMVRTGDVNEIATQSMLIGRAWGITTIRVSDDGVPPAYLTPHGVAFALYAHHSGDRRLAMSMEHVPTYEQPINLWGLGPIDKVAELDPLATRDDEQASVFLINRRFDEPMTVRVDLRQLNPADPNASVKLVRMTGRLEDDGAVGEPGLLESNELAERGVALLEQLVAFGGAGGAPPGLGDGALDAPR